MSSARIDRSDIDRLLREFEVRLTRIMGSASRMGANAPRRAESFGDTIVTALGDMADRFGSRARNVDVTQMSDDANVCLRNRKLTQMSDDANNFDAIDTSPSFQYR